jgi:hypothetical protein
MLKNMTQQQTAAKPPVRKQVSFDLLEELNVLAALATRAPDVPTAQQK